MMAPGLSRVRPTSSADPLALDDDKGNGQWNSNDADDNHRRSDEPRRHVKRTGGNGYARHECLSIKVARADDRQIDSFFDVISRTNRSDINITRVNAIARLLSK